MASDVNNNDIGSYFKLSAYSSGLDGKDKKDYLQKLDLCQMDCPYLFPPTLWQRGIATLEPILPKITERELWIYLCERRSEDTGQCLKAHKTMRDSELYVKNGWVSSLAAIQLRNGNVVATASVHHSQSLSKKPLTPWVTVGTDKLVVAGHCQCTAGHSTICCHVGGVLYSIIAATTLPCTSKENQWLDSRRTCEVGLIAEINQLNTSKARKSPEESSASTKRKVWTESSIPAMTDEDITALRDQLLPLKAVQLSVLNEYADEFLPPELPRPLTSILNIAFRNEPYEVIVAEGKRLKNEGELNCSKEQSNEVSHRTITQRKTPLWQTYRAGVCTASNSHAICRTKIEPDKVSISLLKTIRYPASKPFQTEATRYGTDNEAKCIRRGTAHLKKKNLYPSFYTADCGLILSTKYPGLAASPDGLFYCNCHGEGVVEAKCSWKHRDAMSLSEVATSNKDFYLSFNPESGEFSLKRNHPYYYQVQHQMLVTDRKFAIFMSFIERDIAVLYVPVDLEVCAEIKDKCNDYMDKVMLPQLLAEYFIKPNVEKKKIELIAEPEVNPNSVTVCDHDYAAPLPPIPVPSQSFYKICCQNEAKSVEEVVTCSVPECFIKTYHKSCAQPQRQRYTARWKCKTCESNLRKIKRKSRVESQTVVKKNKGQ